MHDEPLSVIAMCVRNPDCSPVGMIAETKPKLQPRFLRLSAMIFRFLNADYFGMI
jgi:hypothetical protein